MSGHAPTGFRSRLGRWITGLVAPARPRQRTSSPSTPPRHDMTETPRALATAAGVPDTEPQGFHGRKALVADDSEINRIILRTFLERLGFVVKLANDGREAVSNWEPDHELLCLDINMPEQNGMAALAEIRSLARAQALPMPVALAVTVNSLSHQVAEYLSSGFDACLPKPFARAELEKTLHQHWACRAK